MIVVSDTGPIHYLVLIGREWTLSRMFDRVFVPPVVLSELRHPGAPARVRAWVNDLPPWIEQRAPHEPLSSDEADPGEAEAIALARELGTILLADDIRAMRTARGYGVRGFGTLGILQRTHARSWLQIEDALSDLATTNYRHTPALFQRVVEEAHAMRRAAGDGV